MSFPNIDKSKRYSYKEYLSWSENERWEVVDGHPYMQAAPSFQHQRISRELVTQFNNYLKNRPCEVFAAPFDLLLPDNNENDEDISTVLQPDLVVVCDKSKLRGTGYVGVPTLIIEIVSPSTGKMDRIIKFNKYESIGVGEYWIVQPEEKTIVVFKLTKDKRYGRPEVYSEEDLLRVSVFDDLSIDLKAVFT